jgi:hypothetical protein
MKVAAGAFALSQLPVTFGATSSGQPEVTTTASVPSSGSIDITIREDVTGDGVANSSESISVQDGTNTEVVDLLEGDENSLDDYWLEMSFSTNDKTETPRLSTVELAFPDPTREPAFFGVTITDFENTVESFTQSEVTAEVSNTGDRQGTQDIVFEVGGEERGRESGVALSVGDTQTFTFSWGATLEDIGEVDVRVESANDVDIRTVEVVDEDAGVETDPNVSAPQSPTNDRYLNYWLQGDIIQGITRPYSDLLGPIAALIALFSVGGALQINSDTTTLPLVVTVLLSGVLIGSIALPASAIQIAGVLVVLGIAFLGVKLYLTSGTSR